MLFIVKKKKFSEKEQETNMLFFCISATAVCYKIFLQPNHCSLLKAKAAISKLTEKIDQWFPDFGMEK